MSPANTAAPSLPVPEASASSRSPTRPLSSPPWLLRRLRRLARPSPLEGGTVGRRAASVKGAAVPLSPSGSSPTGGASPRAKSQEPKAKSRKPRANSQKPTPTHVSNRLPSQVPSTPRGRVGWPTPKEQPPRESLRHTDREDEANLESRVHSPHRRGKPQCGESLRSCDRRGRRCPHARGSAR